MEEMAQMGGTEVMEEMRAPVRTLMEGRGEMAATLEGMALQEAMEGAVVMGEAEIIPLVAKVVMVGMQETTVSLNKT
ncbi:hypothetical protein [Yersinia mollaretii]|uniref:hypothetical protein n=1 Tax=Yersinia mollaretii TaxID=33060 RepID=UPI0005E54DC4|nr:hypothetical protein [Yersinia mollaretii]CNI32265.1 Uncharacterised protein [Yersinia mollaretii]CNK14350.1 Uncharacterised protein [Yersinia enterocolitica]CQQ55855.1 Uncharacterised protein [Yersinia mollaretii]